MYSDEDFIACPACGDLGRYAPNIFGKETFFHKRPGRFDGYFTFSEICKITNPNVKRKAN